MGEIDNEQISKYLMLATETFRMGAILDWMVSKGLPEEVTFGSRT